MRENGMLVEFVWGSCLPLTANMSDCLCHTFLRALVPKWLSVSDLVPSSAYDVDLVDSILEIRGLARIRSCFG